MFRVSTDLDFATKLLTRMIRALQFRDLNSISAGAQIDIGKFP